MAERDTFISVVDGDQLNQGYFNGILNIAGVYGSVYTGTDFDSLQGATSGTDTNNHTLSLSSSDLGDSNYLVIHATVQTLAAATAGNASNRGSSSVSLTIASQDTGGAGFVTDVSLSMASASTSTVNDFAQDNDRSTGTISILHLLTAAEKSSGIEVKFTSTSTVSVTGSTSCQARLDNKQVWFEGRV